MRRLVNVLVLLTSLLVWEFAVSQETPPKPTDISILMLYQMRGGIVRSEATAVQIAKAILEGLYGQELVKSQEPFVASEEKDRWIVRGSPDDPGFAAVVVISKADASIVDLDVRTPLQ